MCRRPPGCAIMGGPLYARLHTEMLAAWAVGCGWSRVRLGKEGYKTFSILDIKPS